MTATRNTIVGTSLTSGDEWLKSLYYGRPGSGKTTAMASLSKLGLMCAVDFEGGWVKRALKNRGMNTDNIIVFSPRGFDEIEQTYYEIQAMIDRGDGVVGVAVDHMTEVESILVRDAAVLRVDKAKAKLKPSIHVSAADREEYELLSEFRTELADYGVWTNQARKLTRMFRDLPCHVAFGAHERTDVGKLVPGLTEKFRNDLMGSLPMVVYTKAVEVRGTNTVEYLGITKPVKNFAGKDRYDMAPTVLADPHMDRLVGLLNNTLDLSTDPAQCAYEARMAA